MDYSKSKTSKCKMDNFLLEEFLTFTPKVKLEFCEVDDENVNDMCLNESTWEKAMHQDFLFLGRPPSEHTWKKSYELTYYADYIIRWLLELNHKVYEHYHDCYIKDYDHYINKIRDYLGDNVWDDGEGPPTLTWYDIQNRILTGGDWYSFTNMVCVTSDLDEQDTLSVIDLPEIFIKFSEESLIMEDIKVNLPENIGTYQQLKYIYISPNKELPKSFTDLINLEKLFLEDGDIEHLPQDIGRLKNLESISILTLKNLKGLPESILDLQKLKRISIPYHLPKPKELVNRNVTVNGSNGKIEQLKMLTKSAIKRAR